MDSGAEIALVKPVPHMDIFFAAKAADLQRDAAHGRVRGGSGKLCGDALIVSLPGRLADPRPAMHQHAGELNHRNASAR